jgi:hypothetical protein
MEALERVGERSAIDAPAAIGAAPESNALVKVDSKDSQQAEVLLNVERLCLRSNDVVVEVVSAVRHAGPGWSSLEKRRKAFQRRAGR